jgi:hypothetical protein
MKLSTPVIDDRSIGRILKKFGLEAGARAAGSFGTRQSTQTGRFARCWAELLSNRFALRMWKPAAADPNA